MDVLVAHTDNGIFVYATAEDLLLSRVDDGYWYDSADQEEAKRILDSGSESEADRFLTKRKNYEYEGFEWCLVRSKWG